MTRTPGIACGYWNARKSPLCARSSAPGLGDVLAVEEDLPLGHLVGRMAGDRVGERRLARAVRAHDRVHLVRVDREVDALDDLRPVLERDVQILQLQQCQVISFEGVPVTARPPRTTRAWRANPIVARDWAAARTQGDLTNPRCGYAKEVWYDR